MSISFGSKIKFLNDKDFENVRSAHSQKESDWVGPPWNRTVVAQRSGTNKVDQCVTGILTNDASKEVVLGHYRPETAEDEAFERRKGEVRQKLSQMKEYAPRLGGLIVGAKAACAGGVTSKRGKTLESKMNQFFTRELKADVSEISGQRRPTTQIDVASWGDEDTHFLRCYDYLDPAQEVIKGPQDIVDQFEKVEISEKDDLYIGNRKIDKEKLKKLKKTPVNKLRSSQDFFRNQ